MLCLNALYGRYPTKIVAERIKVVQGAGVESLVSISNTRLPLLLYVRKTKTIAFYSSQIYNQSRIRARYGYMKSSPQSKKTKE